MNRGRRWLFRLTLFLGITLGLGWLFFVPHVPGRVMHFVPAWSTLVDVHHGLASRMDQVAENPVALSLFSPGGLSGAELRALVEDRKFRWLARQLADDELVCAYVPTLGYRGRPAWVLVSWVGGRDLVLREILKLRSWPWLQARRTARGHRYWILKSDRLPAALKFSLALDEGVLVGCLSDDPAAIEQVVDVSEGRLPSVASVQAAGHGRWTCSTESARDHGWMNLTGFDLARAWTDPVFWYEFSRVDARELAGRLCRPITLMNEVNVTRPEDSAFMGRLLGNLPFVVGVLNAWTAVELLEMFTTPDTKNLAQSLLQPYGLGPVGLAVLGGDYSGRYLEMKVPALLAAVRVSEPEQVLARMGKIIDQINGRQHWALYAREVPAGDRTVYAVESSGDLPYARLAVNEKLAYALCDDWLLVSSSLKSLLELVARFDREEAREEESQGEWRRPAEPSPLYLWLSLPEFAGAFRTALKLYLVKSQLDVGPASGDDSVRRNANAAMAWVDALALFPEAEMWLTAQPAETSLRFRMGHPGDIHE